MIENTECYQFLMNMRGIELKFHFYITLSLFLTKLESLYDDTDIIRRKT